MSECKQQNKEPWQKWPSRMLRHKAAIQAGRYAFGLSGIIDPDEADRYKDVGVIEKEVNPTIVSGLPEYTQEQFNVVVNDWANAIQKGKLTPEKIIISLKSKFTLTEDIVNQIQELTQGETA